eukprot:Nk52_evm9s214 gene=Nk52_evmTU9s214
MEIEQFMKELEKYPILRQWDYQSKDHLKPEPASRTTPGSTNNAKITTACQKSAANRRRHVQQRKKQQEGAEEEEREKENRGEIIATREDHNKTGGDQAQHEEASCVRRRNFAIKIMKSTQWNIPSPVEVSLRDFECGARSGPSSAKTILDLKKRIAKECPDIDWLDVLKDSNASLATNPSPTTSSSSSSSTGIKLLLKGKPLQDEQSLVEIFCNSDNNKSPVEDESIRLTVMVSKLKSKEKVGQRRESLSSSSRKIGFWDMLKPAIREDLLRGRSSGAGASVSEEEVDKVFEEMRAMYDRMVKGLSLDDIERLARTYNANNALN